MAKKAKNARDEFSKAIKDALAKRVNAHCSNPGCRKPTFRPHSDPNKFVTMGRASHITAAARHGPRYDETLTPEQRSSIENGIWLCIECANYVDADSCPFPPEVLRRWKKTAEEFALQAAPFSRPAGTLPPVWTVPYRRNPNFTGRSVVLTEIANAFTVEPQSDAFRRVQAIVGLSGAGKTHAAVEYAYRSCDRYNAVLWVDAGTRTSLRNSCSQIAAELRLGADDPAEAVRLWLEAHTNWLLVYDDASEIADLEDFLPRSESGHVLITSTNPNWKDLGETRPLGTFTREESIDLLLRRTTQHDRASADELGELLGDLPLAIAQAAGYISEAGRSLSSYVELFRSRRTQLWRNERPPDQYKTAVATAWSLALERLPDSAVAILQVCAFLSTEPIPCSLFTGGKDGLPQTLAEVCSDPLSLDAALRLLRRYSLVSTSDDAILVHRLVQAVVIDRLGWMGETEWIPAAVELVSRRFNYNVHDARTWSEARPLLPHAFYAGANAARLAVSTGGHKAAALLNAAGLYLKMLDRDVEAAQAFEMCLRIFSLDPNEHDVPEAYTRCNLADVQCGLGDLENARVNQLRAIELLEKHLPEDHPGLSTFYSMLAVVEARLDRPIEAKRLLRRAASILKKAPAGTEGRCYVLGKCYGSLGNIEREQGAPRRARVLLHAASAILAREHPAGHPDLADAHLGLAGVELDLGRKSVAVAHVRTAVEILQQHVREEHPTLLRARATLATLAN